jgi:phosphonoacetaldehyde hydrolase
MDSVSRKSYQGPLKAVILDWAGTTVDYGSRAPVAAFLEVYKRYGVEITVKEARAHMGTHKKLHLRRISEMSPVAEKWKQVHGRCCSEDDIEKMFGEFVSVQVACLARYADLIPGTLEAVEAFRRRGLKIGTTTGYTKEMMALLSKEAKRRGYEPDSTVCVSDVQAGRPEPWMCFRNAENLGVYPMQAMAKVGDTLADIHEGLSAGTWTIGLAKTGNELGLSEKEIETLLADELQRRLETAYKRMYEAGAHYVVDGIWACDRIFDEINDRLSSGEKP